MARRFRPPAAAGVALLALAGIAALVLGVLLATGPRALSASGGAAARPAVLASGQSGTRQARVQLAGEESEAADGVVSNDDEEDEEEEPPFGEPQGLPAEACDMEALQNCLGAMMAQTDSLPEGERALAPPSVLSPPSPLLTPPGAGGAPASSPPRPASPTYDGEPPSDDGAFAFAFDASPNPSREGSKPRSERVAESIAVVSDTENGTDAETEAPGGTAYW